MHSAPYRLDELGWLQFERMCDLVLAHEAGLAEVTWRGRADRGGVALLDDRFALERAGVRLPGPLAVVVIWVRSSPSQTERLADLVTGAWSVPSELGFWFERVLVLTNLDARVAHSALTERLDGEREFVVLGAGELADSLDRHPAVRAAMPSVLGLRELEPLIAADVLRSSALDVAAAQELARVFWATRAYDRARSSSGTGSSCSPDPPRWARPRSPGWWRSRRSPMAGRHTSARAPITSGGRSTASAVRCSSPMTRSAPPSTAPMRRSCGPGSSGGCSASLTTATG